MNKKGYLRNNWKKIIFVLSIIIFIILMILLITDNVSAFDAFIYNIIIKIKCKPLTYFFRLITFFCSTLFMFIVSILIMIFSKNKKNAFYIVLNILICVVLNQCFKIIFSRARPVDINLITALGFSFPSGHSMVSLAFYGFIIYILIHRKISKKKKKLYTTLLTILILLIGISRIYLGVHYASDVCAGYALSMAYLIIYIKLFYKKLKY